jgi:hypothetical protein
MVDGLVMVCGAVQAALVYSVYAIISDPAQPLDCFDALEGARALKIRFAAAPVGFLIA